MHCLYKKNFDFLILRKSWHQPTMAISFFILSMFLLWTYFVYQLKTTVSQPLTDFIVSLLGHPVSGWSSVRTKSTGGAISLPAEHMPNENAPLWNSAIAQIKALSHPSAQHLHYLIAFDGAGMWPPRALHGLAWPEQLRTYHDIYQQLAPMLSQESNELSADDGVNFLRCLEYRNQMRKFLQEQINLVEIQRILTLAEEEADLFPVGSWSRMTAAVWNGFFACIALSRHAFRWGTIPIVKLAQHEQVVAFPPELDLPWSFLRRRYGVTSPGGNLTSNYFCNFDAKGQLVYPINVGLSETITTAEYLFAHIFPAIEKEALSIYTCVVSSIAHYEQGERDACLSDLQHLVENLRVPLKIYYDTMVNSKIDRRVWMSHVQGFQGWAAGEVVNGECIKYEGLSGNQLLLYHVVDAFLGLDNYLPAESRLRYIPASQRAFVDPVRAHSFRCKAQSLADREIEALMREIVRQMLVFRTAHRVRVRPYLTVPARERLAMTAGKGLLENEEVKSIEAAIDGMLDGMLVKRIKETR